MVSGFFSPQHPSSQLLSAGDQPGTGEVLDRMDNGKLGKSMGKIITTNGKIHSKWKFIVVYSWENPWKVSLFGVYKMWTKSLGNILRNMIYNYSGNKSTNCECLLESIDLVDW